MDVFSGYTSSYPEIKALLLFEPVNTEEYKQVQTLKYFPCCIFQGFYTVLTLIY